ncbi:hypothetical protein PUNSTDRAFT_51836 [Punctularia strigosozonata HHB-11173 SS5]|uniref:uncharacterized protein n=1 Tax=Punctularia strigosozonata (strain HHB-11173) TaxID=741275 RepID=UPI0004417F09|nr:uncharacterized protein PUNSTDRAFT_51836 [Punctularia strigosozonata HHB-11173 SS5]EIN09604.1 hypothetical protein PUNSTDRAFT_51836 [Punctularia strigosozonata HHB-11173 SS5]
MDDEQRLRANHVQSIQRSPFARRPERSKACSESFSGSFLAPPGYGRRTSPGRRAKYAVTKLISLPMYHSNDPHRLSRCNTNRLRDRLTSKPSSGSCEYKCRSPRFRHTQR